MQKPDATSVDEKSQQTTETVCQKPCCAKRSAMKARKDLPLEENGIRYTEHGFGAYKEYLSDVYDEVESIGPRCRAIEIANIGPEETVLDLACGEGQMYSALFGLQQQRDYSKLYFADAAIDAVNKVKSVLKVADQGRYISHVAEIDMRRADLMQELATIYTAADPNFPAKEGFDVVILNRVLHHIEPGSQGRLIEHLLSCLKPGPDSRILLNYLAPHKSVPGAVVTPMIQAFRVSTSIPGLMKIDLLAAAHCVGKRELQWLNTNFEQIMLTAPNAVVYRSEEMHGRKPVEKWEDLTARIPEIVEEDITKGYVDASARDMDPMMAQHMVLCASREAQYLNRFRRRFGSDLVIVRQALGSNIVIKRKV